MRELRKQAGSGGAVQSEENTQASITGVVRYLPGAVLPGVASRPPALRRINGVRTGDDRAKVTTGLSAATSQTSSLRSFGAPRGRSAGYRRAGASRQSGGRRPSSRSHHPGSRSAAARGLNMPCLRAGTARQQRSSESHRPRLSVDGRKCLHCSRRIRFIRRDWGMT